MAGKRAPTHLKAPTAAFWRGVIAQYELEPHHERLLTACCEAWDRTQEARATLAKEGSYFKDRHGQPRAHPAVAVERDARIQFARLVRELDLDGEPSADPRPPRRAS